MRLTLIRHGETEWNATGTWQGQSDVPLSPRGRLQVRALAARMFGAEFDHAYSSDLSRAMETATALPMPVLPHTRFREIDVGRWSGLTRAQVRERFAEQIAAMYRGEDIKIGGGESMMEFEARVDTAIASLRAVHEGERVALVTHGGVVRATTTGILRCRARESALTGVGNTSISIVRVGSDRLLLERYNDGCHLEAADQDSALTRGHEPSTRLALVVARPDAPTDRALVDAILGGLEIAQYYATPEVEQTVLAKELFADGGGLSELSTLRGEHEDGAFAWVVSSAQVAPLLGEVLGLPPDGVAGFVAPAHGTISQVRLFPGRAELYSFAVPTCRAQDVPLA